MADVVLIIIIVLLILSVLLLLSVADGVLKVIIIYLYILSVEDDVVSGSSINIKWLMSY
jgi:hypothetical protein